MPSRGSLLSAAHAQSICNEARIHVLKAPDNKVKLLTSMCKMTDGEAIQPLPAAEENGHEEESEPQGLQHDDDIGEEVPFSEAQMICDSIVRQVWLPCSMSCQSFHCLHACPLLHDGFGKEATLSEAQMICDVIARQVGAVRYSCSDLSCPHALPVFIMS